MTEQEQTKGTVDLGTAGFRIRAAIRQRQGMEKGRTQVLDILQALVDENLKHDNWDPDHAEILRRAKSEIVRRLEKIAP